MKIPFGNKITWCTVRKNSQGKKEVVTLTGLPGDMNYELYKDQPTETDDDAYIVYLLGSKKGSKPMLIGIHKDDLQFIN